MSKAFKLREKGPPDAPSDRMIRKARHPVVERIESTRTELDRLAHANDWRRRPRPKRRKSYKLGMLVRCGSPEERRRAGFRLLQRLRGLRYAEAARKRGYWNFQKRASTWPAIGRPKPATSHVSTHSALWGLTRVFSSVPPVHGVVWLECSLNKRHNPSRDASLRPRSDPHTPQSALLLSRVPNAFLAGPRPIKFEDRKSGRGGGYERPRSVCESARKT